MFACPIRSGYGTFFFRYGRGPEGWVCRACRVSDCGHGGDSSRGVGFTYHVGDCGSCCRRLSLLETCCGGCADRAGSPFVVDLIRWTASTRVSSTPIRLWPANDRRGCCQRCWPHGAWLVSMPYYLKLLAEQRHHAKLRYEARLVRVQNNFVLLSLGSHR